MVQTGDVVTLLNDLINGIGFAMLTTVRPNGTLHSRPMACQGMDAAGVIWLVSGNNTDTVEAIRTSQQVNLSYTDHAMHRYVSVSGYCELVRDRVQAKVLWQPEYKSWLPDGLDDSNLILLKIDVQQAEYWDANQGRMLELGGFASAAFD